MSFVPKLRYIGKREVRRLGGSIEGGVDTWRGGDPQWQADALCATLMEMDLEGDRDCLLLGTTSELRELLRDRGFDVNGFIRGDDGFSPEGVAYGGVFSDFFAICRGLIQPIENYYAEIELDRNSSYSIELDLTQAEFVFVAHTTGKYAHERIDTVGSLVALFDVITHGDTRYGYWYDTWAYTLYKWLMRSKAEPKAPDELKHAIRQLSERSFPEKEAKPNVAQGIPWGMSARVRLAELLVEHSGLIISFLDPMIIAPRVGTTSGLQEPCIVSWGHFGTHGTGHLVQGNQ